MIVLTLNSGSSSLKFGLYRVEATELGTLMTGDLAGCELHAKDSYGTDLPGSPISVDTPDATIEAIVSLLTQANLPAPEAIGHRIVHGGPELRAHCLIDEEVEGALEAATALSPLHAPAALALIRLAAMAWPNVPQAACFDTAFHAGMPDIARILPVAKELQADGVQRYGFHGLSCESIVRQLGDALQPRTIIAHLGSGASITAVRDGRSIDTSMGLTPSGGIVMATRSGNLDPGLIVYLLREKGFDAEKLEQLIDHRSGLFGISGVSGDLRALHEAAPSNVNAQLAVAIFCLSVAKEIAGMIVALGGVDAIVYTGGIGEHDAAVRSTVQAHLGGCGVQFTDNSDERVAKRIGAPGAGCRLHVLPSLEDGEIARHTYALSVKGYPAPKAALR